MSKLEKKRHPILPPISIIPSSPLQNQTSPNISFRSPFSRTTNDIHANECLIIAQKENKSTKTYFNFPSVIPPYPKLNKCFYGFYNSTPLDSPKNLTLISESNFIGSPCISVTPISVPGTPGPFIWPDSPYYSISEKLTPTKNNYSPCKSPSETLEVNGYVQIAQIPLVGKIPNFNYSDPSYADI